MGCEHIVDMVAWILRARIGRVGLFGNEMTLLRCLID